MLKEHATETNSKPSNDTINRLNKNKMLQRHYCRSLTDSRPDNLKILPKSKNTQKRSLCPLSS